MSKLYKLHAPGQPFDGYLIEADNQIQAVEWANYMFDLSDIFWEVSEIISQKEAGSESI